MIVGVKTKEVKKRLARKNLSLNGFARNVGISSGYISQLMCGIRHPSPKLRQSISDYFECEFDDIFFIQDPD